MDTLGEGDVPNSQCLGEPEIKEECNAERCPMWTEWSEWSQCSTTCGGGRRQRGRECAAPTFRNGRYFCDGGDDYEEEACNENVNELSLISKLLLFIRIILGNIKAKIKSILFCSLQKYDCLLFCAGQMSPMDGMG